MNSKIAIIIGLIFGFLILILIALLYLQGKTQSPPQKKEPSVVTVAPIENAPPLDRSDAPVETWNKAMDEYRIKMPDFFLANHTPYENESFAIERVYEPLPKPHFSFSVILKTKDTPQIRRDVENWIISLGLTSQQVNNLEINYSIEK